MGLQHLNLCDLRYGRCGRSRPIRTGRLVEDELLNRTARGQGAASDALNDDGSDETETLALLKGRRIIAWKKLD